jgi:hypothetical protein
MCKSKLTDPEWLALCAGELAGVWRRVLAVKYGVNTAAISHGAVIRGVRDRGP